MTTRTDWIARVETDADIPTVRDINLAAFATALEADIIGALRGDPSSDGPLTGYALLDPLPRR
jgi:putative acetyltransferase